MNFKDYMKIDGAKPLDKILDDGGYTAIFRSIAVVGDSLASGEFEATEDGKTLFIDKYEYSWGQFIARMCGNKVYNFSRGGMTAREYWETWGEANGVWDEEKKCQAYIIALGVNDLFWVKGTEMGCLDDIDTEDYNNNKETVVGFYARILQRYQQMQPDAKFFLVAMPRIYGENEELSEEQKKRNEKRKAWPQILKGIAKMFKNVFVIDLYENAPVFDGEFYKFFGLGGHLNPMGYYLMGKIISTYIDWIIRKNPNEFKTVGFIGTQYKNDRVKTIDSEVK